MRAARKLRKLRKGPREILENSFKIRRVFPLRNNRPSLSLSSRAVSELFEFFRLQVPPHFFPFRFMAILRRLALGAAAPFSEKTL
jgi:hypothetical protein